MPPKSSSSESLSGMVPECADDHHDDLAETTAITSASSRLVEQASRLDAEPFVEKRPVSPLRPMENGNYGSDSGANGHYSHDEPDEERGLLASSRTEALAPPAPCAPEPSSAQRGPPRRPSGGILRRSNYPVLPSAPTAATSYVSSANAAESAVDTAADAKSKPAVVIFGCDLSSYPHHLQFLLCAGGLFVFTVMYGYLQELVVVTLVDRKLAGFVSTVQFAGYAFWSFVLSRLRPAGVDANRRGEGAGTAPVPRGENGSGAHGGSGARKKGKKRIPASALIGCSLLKAVDLGLTNAAMSYINYPAKTLLKSSRVFFTMITGIIVNGKRYKLTDYVVVGFLVTGLAVFLRAESSSSAVFHPLGVAMLCLSLILDGAVINWSERAMNEYGMCHDDFNCRLYTISLLATAACAHANGELARGAEFIMSGGTMGQQLEAAERAQQVIATGVVPAGAGPPLFWTPSAKMLVFLLFSTLGVFGASCGGAITKSFGAFATSVTSTVRKATTLFLSFALFPSNNTCTFQHVQGMIIFFAALTVKSVRAASKHRKGGKARSSPKASARKDAAPVAPGKDEESLLPMASSSSSNQKGANGKQADSAIPTTTKKGSEPHDTGRYLLRSLSAVSITELMGGDLSSDDEEDEEDPIAMVAAKKGISSR